MKTVQSSPIYSSLLILACKQKMYKKARKYNFKSPLKLSLFKYASMDQFYRVIVALVSTAPKKERKDTTHSPPFYLFFHNYQELYEIIKLCSEHLE